MALELFVVTNARAFPSAHALLIEPFKTIWEEDMTDKKEEAIKIFSYVELLCSPRKSNPFYGCAEDVRPAHVKREIWGDNPPANATRIIAAVSKYKELLTTASSSYSLLTSARVAAGELEDHLNTLDFSERTTSGAMVLKPKDVTTALKDIPDVIRSLDQLYQKVNQDLVEDSKTRNEREIGEYER